MVGQDRAHRQSRALTQIKQQASKQRLQALQTQAHLGAVADAQEPQVRLVAKVESPLRLARIVLQSAGNTKSLKHQLLVACVFLRVTALR
ncbi:hypothetical protein QP671_28075, partial [Klebsiella pneumoniae]|nr:hypothetical protein [Klebsiella pneumoniae]